MCFKLFWCGTLNLKICASVSIIHVILIFLWSSHSWLFWPLVSVSNLCLSCSPHFTWFWNIVLQSVHFCSAHIVHSLGWPISVCAVCVCGWAVNTWCKMVPGTIDNPTMSGTEKCAITLSSVSNAVEMTLIHFLWPLCYVCLFSTVSGTTMSQVDWFQAHALSVQAAMVCSNQANPTGAHIILPFNQCPEVCVLKLIACQAINKIILNICKQHLRS